MNKFTVKKVGEDFFQIINENGGIFLTNQNETIANGICEVLNKALQPPPQIAKKLETFVETANYPIEEEN